MLPPEDLRVIVNLSCRVIETAVAAINRAPTDRVRQQDMLAAILRTVDKLREAVAPPGEGLSTLVNPNIPT